MAPVRVAFDTGPLYGPRTGIGHAVAALREALAARTDVAVQPYLLSFRATPEPPTVRLPLPAAAAQRVWARTAHPRADRWLPGAEVVHGTNYVLPPTRLPGLVSVYDCWFLRHPAQASPAVRRAGAVLRASIGRGAVVHVSSDATRRAVEEFFPGARVRMVHLGALPLPEVGEPVGALDGAPFVLAVGTLERRKNLPGLVKAFVAVAADRADLRLVLAGGNGDDAAAVRDAVDALGPQLAPRVLFTGRVSEGTRGWLLRHAAVLAYPSLDEGFGFPLLDGFQAGVPVVASTAGSIPEVAGDAALLCPADDVDGLAAALSTALDDDALRQRLTTAGHERWPRFTWPDCAAEMASLYRGLRDGDLDTLEEGSA